MTRTVRVACYGTGNFAVMTHLPNLRKLPGVEIVALCDINEERLAAAAREFGVSALYTDHHEMLERERIDALFSVVHAHQRTDCEIIAAKKGIHLFIEKPQAADMERAKEIDQAIQESGVISTVGFRERFRPSVEAARDFMAGRDFLVGQRISFGEMPASLPEQTLEQMGGLFLGWGTHFIDQLRYITGQEVEAGQAFFVDDPRRAHQEDLPVGYCASFRFRNGAVANWTIIASLPRGQPRPALVAYEMILGYRGGLLEVRYDQLRVNGEIIYDTEATDPWFLSVEAFIEAIRTGVRSLIRNDFSDGLLSLAPVLAALHSARPGGKLVNIREFAGL